MISIIVAIDNNGAIGKDGDLLCHMPADLKHFKEVTMGHPIVMGSRTYMSFPRRPLPGRRNIVVSRDPHKQLEGAEMFSSLEEALAATKDKNCFVIGGGSVYEQVMQMGVVERICLTQIHHSFDEADTFFPKIDPTLWQMTEQEEHEADEKNPYPYTYITLTKIK